VSSFFSLSRAAIYQAFTFSTSYFKTDEQEEAVSRQFLQYLFLRKRVITETLGQKYRYHSEFEMDISNATDRHVVMERIHSYLISKTKTSEREREREREREMKAVLCRPNTVT